MFAFNAWHRCAKTALRCARGGLIASLCIAGNPNVGVAAMGVSPIDPRILALMNTPIMQKAIAEAHKGNLRGAAALFQEAARHGNQMGNISLSMAYFDGRGVPRDHTKALFLLNTVIHKNENPTVLVAFQMVDELCKRLKNSPDPKDRELADKEVLASLASTPYVQQWGENMSHVRVVPCFMC